MKLTTVIAALAVVIGLGSDSTGIAAGKKNNNTVINQFYRGCVFGMVITVEKLFEVDPLLVIARGDKKHSELLDNVEAACRESIHFYNSKVPNPTEQGCKVGIYRIANAKGKLHKFMYKNHHPTHIGAIMIKDCQGIGHLKHIKKHTNKIKY